MLDSLYVAATGMQAHQFSVDTIANNLVNLNTPAYKRSRVSFSDLVSTPINQIPNDLGDRRIGGPSLSSIAGVAVAGVQKMFEMGEIKQTDSMYDLALAGDGFLEVTMPDGSIALSRGGTLSVNSEGLLATRDGFALKPNIYIPSDTVNLAISASGQVVVKTAKRATPTEIGQLDLVKVPFPSALSSLGDGLYRLTDAAGLPVSGRAGEDGIGAIKQGYIEGSNVKLVDEMVTLMLAQRSYEASAKIIQASDEMLGMINSLRR